MRSFGPRLVLSVCGLTLAAPAARSADKPEAIVSSLIAEAERHEDLRLLIEAARLYRQAADQAATEGRRGDQAWALARECRAFWGADQPARAAAICEEALRLARAAASPRAEAEAEKLLGVLDMGRGDYVSSVRRLRRAVTLAERSGETETQISALNNLSAAALEQGRVADAVAYGGQALERSESFPGTSVRMRFAVPYNLAKALEAAGDDEAARRLLDLAARSAAETNFIGGLHHVLMDSAALLLRAGDLDGAGAYYVVRSP